MNTPTLTEQFRTVAQAVLDECSRLSGKDFDSIIFTPSHGEPFAVFSGSKCTFANSVELLFDQCKNMRGQIDNERADKIASLKAVLAKLEAGQ